MKKLGKFLFGTVALATVAAGAYYLYKKFFKQDEADDFDDFEDDFEDFDTEEELENDSREYVSIDITGDDDSLVDDDSTVEEE